VLLKEVGRVSLESIEDFESTASIWAVRHTPWAVGLIFQRDV